MGNQEDSKKMAVWVVIFAISFLLVLGLYSAYELGAFEQAWIVGVAIAVFAVILIVMLFQAAEINEANEEAQKKAELNS